MPINKPFTDQPNAWWDPKGPYWTLHAINPLRLGFILQYIKNGNALDIGCGGGILTEALANHFNILGMDADQALIDIANSRESNARYQHGYLSSIVADHQEHFDLVTCLEVLEHVDNPQEMVRHIGEVTKPGGYVFFSTLNRNPISFLGAIVAAEYILNLLPKHTHQYEKFITPAELINMAEAAHLELVDIQGILYNPLTKHFFTGKSTIINYIACFKKRS